MTVVRTKEYTVLQSGDYKIRFNEVGKPTELIIRQYYSTPGGRGRNVILGITPEKAIQIKELMEAYLKEENYNPKEMECKLPGATAGSGEWCKEYCTVYGTGRCRYDERTKKMMVMTEDE